MTIGTIIEKYPQTTDVLLGYGLQCVGCSVNPFETLEQGALGHGMEEDTLQSLLDEVNLVVTKKAPFEMNPDGITLSPNALDTLESMMSADDKEGFGLKVQATKTDGGLDYYLDIVAEPEEEEEVKEWQGMKYFISKESQKLMAPSVIDYVAMPSGEGFKIIALQDEERCPCDKPMSQCDCKGEKSGEGCCGGGCGC
jgi:hybrid cluster-associated redox disulfide protein